MHEIVSWKRAVESQLVELRPRRRRSPRYSDGCPEMVAPWRDHDENEWHQRDGPGARVGAGS